VARAIQPSARGRIERRLWRPSQNVDAGRRHRRTQRIDCYVPAPIAAWDPPLTAATAALVAEADGELRQLDREAPRLLGLEALSRQLLRQESVGSSRIEGLAIGQRRLARAAVGIGRDEIASQIVGNVAAMEEAIALAAAPRAPTGEDLLAIHRTLFAATSDAHLGGVVRTEQNWIGGSAFSPAGAEFVPPPPEYVGDLLDDLVAFLDRDDLPVTLQAAIAHAQFETIHPFADGNGRTGRCLIHVVNRRRGLAVNVVPPVSLVLATHGSEYIGGLTEYRFGDPVRWLLFYAAATVKAVDRAHDLARRIETLREAWLERLGQPRRDASARTLAEQLPAEPIVSVTRAAQLAGVSDTAAARAVAALEGAGILRPASKQAWGRRWEAPEVFALLDDFERDLATPEDEAGPVRPVPRRADR
jgi:Fic family protein